MEVVTKEGEGTGKWMCAVINGCVKSAKALEDKSPDDKIKILCPDVGM